MKEESKILHCTQEILHKIPHCAILNTFLWPLSCPLPFDMWSQASNKQYIKILVIQLYRNRKATVQHHFRHTDQ